MKTQKILITINIVVSIAIGLMVYFTHPLMSAPAQEMIFLPEPAKIESVQPLMKKANPPQQKKETLAPKVAASPVSAPPPTAGSMSLNDLPKNDQEITRDMLFKPKE